MTKKTTKTTKAKAAPKASKGGKATANPERAKSATTHLRDKPIEPLIVRAAMDIAGELGWSEVNSVEVAKRAKVPLERVREICPNKIDLLRMLGEEINIVMLDGGEVDGSIRDNLFELMMRRFEALQEYRAGVLAVVDAAKREPGMVFKLAGDFHDVLGHVLDMAGVNPSPLRRVGLGAVALATFRTWCEDESDDLAATMSVLDKRLGQIEQAAEALGPLMRSAA